MKASIILFCGLIGGAITAGADTVINMDQAKSLFVTTLYPYMRQNCAECHSETSVNPHGPEHSHSDPNIAFLKFSGYVNWENAESSRIVKMVSSRHFCTDYKYNCKSADQIAMDYSKLLTNYVMAVKQASLVASPPAGSVVSTGTSQNNGADLVNAQPTILVSGTKVSDVEYSFDLNSKVQGRITDQPLRVKMLLEPYGSASRGFLRLKSLELVGSSGYYRVRGIHIYVNGHSLSAHSELEVVNRAISLEYGESCSEPLSMVHPIFKLEENSQVQLGFVTLNELREYPTRICTDAQLKNNEYALNGLGIIAASDGSCRSNSFNDVQMCYKIESQIDFEMPRRSLLLATLDRNSSDYANSVRGVLDRIEAVRPKQIEAPSDLSFDRGKALFNAAGCAHCHSDVDNGGAALGGGLALKTAFGTFYTPNISSDPDHGIGNWSDQDFIKALRTGVRRDGSPYYPVFPYRSFSKMSDQDLLAIKGYIMSLPPASTVNRDHELSFLYRFRKTLWAWQDLYFKKPSGNPERDIKIAVGPLQKDPSKGTEWNRGAYLVEAVAHCAECHTPRDSMGGPKLDMWLAGDPASPLGRPVPNITPALRTGKGSWTEKDWTKFLATGIAPDGKVARAEMGQVTDGLNLLPKEYLRAMAIYLKSLTPVGQ
jgi:mono/diheme cytochrome c family protein